MITQSIASIIYSKSNSGLSALYQFLASLTPRGQKFNFQGIVKFQEKDYNAATNLFLKQLNNSPKHIHALRNLAFVCSNFCSSQQNEYILHLIKKNFNNDTSLLLLSLSLELQLNKEKGKNRIAKEYLDQWIKPSIRNIANKPLLYFHIPKCGGTTITQSLYQYFYSSKQYCLPSYTEKELLKYCIEECADAFPFISTNHLGLETINVNFSEFLSFTILRDPLKRNFSAFRQTLPGIKHGRSFKVIPKYGTYWDYFKVSSFEDWLNFTPTKLLARQVSTFSPSLNLSEFKSTIDKLNAVIALNQLKPKKLDAVFQTFGLGDSSMINFDKKLNKSNKSVKITDKEIDYAKEKLKPFRIAVNQIIENCKVGLPQKD